MRVFWEVFWDGLVGGDGRCKFEKRRDIGRRLVFFYFLLCKNKFNNLCCFSKKMKIKKKESKNISRNSVFLELLMGGGRFYGFDLFDI